jgi:hypothetical protein
LTHRQIVALLERKVITAELFDEGQIVEVFDPEEVVGGRPVPRRRGMRLGVCCPRNEGLFSRNPFTAIPKEA